MDRRGHELVPSSVGMSLELEAIEVVRLDSNIKSSTIELSKKDEQHSSKKSRKMLMLKQIFDRRGPYLPTLNKIFLASSVIAVITDTFFLYIPSLNEDEKCLRMDKNLKIAALVLRSITDLSYILHIIFHLYAGFMAKTSVEREGKNGLVKYALARARMINWSYILIDVLAILPVPQVVILVYFSRIRPGLKSLSTRELLLYMVLFFQYIPKVVRIYLSSEDLKKTRDKFSKTIWVRGVFNLFLYIMASHILGAFWYFFSVDQGMTCWHYACKNQIGCFPDVFRSCKNDNSLRNISFVDDFCPINPPNATVFDFGIFLGAIQNGIVSTDFPKKLLECFWWGLRNLSSFGSNLETSSRAWEILFATFISMLGLLLFLYLIGNLQLYMQLSTQRLEDKRHNKKEEIKKMIKAREPDIDLWASTHKLRDPEEVKKVIKTYMLDTLENDTRLNFKKLEKKLHSYLLQDQPQQDDNNGQLQLTSSPRENDHLDMNDLRIIHLKLEAIISGGKRKQWNKTEESAQLWMLRNGIPRYIMPMIKQYVYHRLQNQKDDVDMVTLFSILPVELQRLIKQHLCLDNLKKVPELKNVDNDVFEEIIKHLKPVSYAENSYIIRKGEPISHMIFVTQGVVWAFGDGMMRNVAKGDYYGEQLMEWQLRSASFSKLPISATNVQSHTKVEALALKAVDLKHILTKYWWKLPIAKQYEVELLKRFAASAIGEAWLRSRLRKQKDQSFRWSLVDRRLRGVTAWIPSR